jgi:hypothetical protein
MGARVLLASCTAITMLGCSFTRIESYTPRTATEQLLVSQAFERAVQAIDLPDLAGRAVAVEKAMMGSGQEFASDASFAKAMIETAVTRDPGDPPAEGLAGEGIRAAEKPVKASRRVPGVAVELAVMTTGTGAPTVPELCSLC